MLTHADLQALTAVQGIKRPVLVDVWLRNPAGQRVHLSESASDGEFTVRAQGSAGAWQLCFKKSDDHAGWEPTKVQLSYFAVEVAALKHLPAHAPEVQLTAPNLSMREVELAALPRQEHVDELLRSLLTLDRQLQAVGNVQKHLHHVRNSALCLFRLRCHWQCQGVQPECTTHYAQIDRIVDRIHWRVTSVRGTAHVGGLSWVCLTHLHMCSVRSGT